MSVIRIFDHPQRRGVFRLETSQLIDRPIDEVFDYFSAAQNLEELTPEWMRFHVVTPEPIEMDAGRLIDYRLRVHGIPLSWQSEITVWEPPRRFVDVQRSGPYRLWHHEHTFEVRDGGTLVCDRVDYAVPGGRLVNSLFVRRDLQRIFEYRGRKLRDVFSTSSVKVAE